LVVSPQAYKVFLVGIYYNFFTISCLAGYVFNLWCQFKKHIKFSVEPTLLGVLAIIAIFLRGNYDALMNGKYLSLILLGALCISGMLIWVFIPFLPF